MMDDLLKALVWMSGAAVLLAGSGAFFAFGVASVCRWMKWSPVSITVNLINRNPAVHWTADEDTTP